MNNTRFARSRHFSRFDRSGTAGSLVHNPNTSWTLYYLVTVPLRVSLCRMQCLLMYALWSQSHVVALRPLTLQLYGVSNIIRQHLFQVTYWSIIEPVFRSLPFQERRASNRIVYICEGLVCFHQPFTAPWNTPKRECKFQVMVAEV